MANILNPISCLVVISVLLINGAIAKDTLYRGESLFTNQYLENGPYRFIMQNDCNLVLYLIGYSALWSSQTNGRGSACRLTLGYNGNLVIVSGSRNVWMSYSGRGRYCNYYRLIVQNDGNVVIYCGSRALWATNTVQRKVP